MEELNYSLNEKNLKDIPFDKYEKNFTFIVNGKKYSTNRIVADILSPIIRKLHFVDESVNEFIIDTDNQQGDDYFSEFLNLINLNYQTFDSNRMNQFANYFIKLGNVIEYFRIHPSNISSFTTENAVQLLLQIEKLLNMPQNLLIL